MHRGLSKQNFELKIASITQSRSFSPYPGEAGLVKQLWFGFLGRKKVAAKEGNTVVLITLSALNSDPKAKKDYVDSGTPVVSSNQFVLKDGLGNKHHPIIFYGNKELDKKLVGVAIPKGQSLTIDVWFEVPESEKCLKRLTLSVLDAINNKKVLYEWNFKTPKAA